MFAFRAVPAAVRLPDPAATLNNATAIELRDAIAAPALNADAYCTYAKKHLETTRELILS